MQPYNRQQQRPVPYHELYHGKRARQDRPLPGREAEMTLSSDGAYVFEADPSTVLDRFLILGSDQPTYYASARKLTQDNARVIEALIREDAMAVVERIAEVSDAGRAPNNNPALMALAMCVALAPNSKVRNAAMAELPRVARIPTHLFHFLTYAQAFGQGWGRSFKRGVANWFTSKDVDRLAYLAMKYKQRDGWALNDVLQKAHPRPNGDENRNALYRWVTWNEIDEDLFSQQLLAAIRLQTVTNATEAALIILDHRLPREVVPTQFLNSEIVWDALLEAMPITAMIRSLAKMTAVGLLAPISAAAKLVVRRLGDSERLRKARVHPIAVLKALRTYEQGHGDRGNLTWKPLGQIVDGLNDAFYASFGNVEPTGKRTGLFLDVSSSMTCGSIGGLNMTPREASAAMALVTANVEQDWEIFGFSSPRGTGCSGSSLQNLTITPRQRLNDAVRAVSGLNFGSTALELPMTVAKDQKWDIDTFVIYTDNETNHYGGIHPAQALREYRQFIGHDAKLVVVGMIANQITIADPKDGGMLDVVGFDTAAPNIISHFARAGV